MGLGSTGVCDIVELHDYLRRFSNLEKSILLGEIVVEVDEPFVLLIEVVHLLVESGNSLGVWNLNRQVWGIVDWFSRECRTEICVGQRGRISFGSILTRAQVVNLFELSSFRC